jgi:hypothetical protein
VRDDNSGDENTGMAQTLMASAIVKAAIPPFYRISDADVQPENQRLRG